jgi:hypothetical protein
MKENIVRRMTRKNWSLGSKDYLSLLVSIYYSLLMDALNLEAGNTVIQVVLIKKAASETLAQLGMRDITILVKVYYQHLLPLQVQTARI